MLITAYGKQGDFNRAEKVLSFMNRKSYLPNVVSHTALLEAYGRGGKYNNAEAIFRRMQSSGPEPSALTYQIMLKIFVEVTYLCWSPSIWWYVCKCVCLWCVWVCLYGKSVHVSVCVCLWWFGIKVQIWSLESSLVDLFVSLISNLDSVIQLLFYWAY